MSFTTKDMPGTKVLKVQQPGYKPVVQNLEKSNFDSSDSYCFQDWIQQYGGSLEPDRLKMLSDLKRVLVVINRVTLSVIAKRKSYSQELDDYIISFDDFSLSEFGSNWSKVGFTQDGTEMTIATYVNKNIVNITMNDYYFDPTRQIKATKDVFNIFEGLVSKPKDHGIDISPLLKHISLVLSNENDQYFQYILKWMKRSYVKLEKTNVALLFVGMEGSGKGVFFQKFVIPFLFGSKYGMTNDNISRLFQQFNGLMAHKLFIVADESKSKVNGTEYDLLKSLITNTERDVEFKFKERKVVKDCINYVFCTNNYNTIPITETCRRFAVFGVDSSFAPMNPTNESSERQEICDNYWKSLVSCFTKKHAEQFLHYLDTKVDDNFNLEANIPHTDARKNMITLGMNPILLFAKQVIEIHDKEFIKRLDMYSKYQIFCLDNSIIKPLNKVDFYKSLLATGKFRDVRNAVDGFRAV